MKFTKLESLVSLNWNNTQFSIPLKLTLSCLLVYFSALIVHQDTIIVIIATNLLLGRTVCYTIVGMEGLAIVIIRWYFYKHFLSLFSVCLIIFMRSSWGSPYEWTLCITWLLLSAGKEKLAEFPVIFNTSGTPKTDS